MSQRLETLANQNLNVEDALLSISENIRNTATVLEVLALVRDQSKELRKNATEHQPKRFLM